MYFPEPLSACPCKPPSLPPSLPPCPDDVLASLDARTAAHVTAKVFLGTPLPPLARPGSACPLGAQASGAPARPPSTEPHAPPSSVHAPSLSVPSADSVPSTFNPMDGLDALGDLLALGDAPPPASEAGEDLSAADTEDVAGFQRRGTAELEGGQGGLGTPGQQQQQLQLQQQQQQPVGLSSGALAAAAATAAGQQPGQDLGWRRAAGGASRGEEAAAAAGPAPCSRPLLQGATVVLVTQSVRWALWLRARVFACVHVCVCVHARTCMFVCVFAAGCACIDIGNWGRKESI